MARCPKSFRVIFSGRKLSPVHAVTRALLVFTPQAWIENEGYFFWRVEHPTKASSFYVARVSTEPGVQKVARVFESAVGPMVHERCPALWLPCTQENVSSEASL